MSSQKDGSETEELDIAAAYRRYVYGLSAAEYCSLREQDWNNTVGFLRSQQRPLPHPPEQE
jgi:hypothetical protein